MAQRLLSIPWVYWSVLRAMALTTITIVFWVGINILLGTSGNQSRDSEPIYEGGFWWVAYTIAPAVLVAVISHHDAPGWLVKAIVATFVLAVLPLYWAFHREPAPFAKPT